MKQNNITTIMQASHPNKHGLRGHVTIHNRAPSPVRSWSLIGIAACALLLGSSATAQEKMKELVSLEPSLNWVQTFSGAPVQARDGSIYGFQDRLLYRVGPNRKVKIMALPSEVFSIVPLETGGLLGLTSNAVVQILPDGTIAPLASFTDRVGIRRGCRLTPGGKQQFFGYARGLNTSKGALFKVAGDGKLTIVHEFNDSEGLPEKCVMTNPVVLQDGMVYGIACATNKTPSMIYRWSGEKGLEIVKTLPAEAEPAIDEDPVFDGQGACFLTREDSIVRVCPDGKIETLFKAEDKWSLGWPGDLISDGKGTLYGTAGIRRIESRGGVFRLSKNREFKFLTDGKQFNAGNGGSIGLDAQGNVIGNDRLKGEGRTMCVYRVNPEGQVGVIPLPREESIRPIVARNGELYALRTQQGEADTILRITADGKRTEVARFTEPGTFSGSDQLIMDDGGKILGTRGFANKEGDVFLVDPAKGVKSLAKGMILSNLSSDGNGGYKVIVGIEKEATVRVLGISYSGEVRIMRTVKFNFGSFPDFIDKYHNHNKRSFCLIAGNNDEIFGKVSAYRGPWSVFKVSEEGEPVAIAEGPENGAGITNPLFSDSAGNIYGIDPCAGSSSEGSGMIPHKRPFRLSADGQFQIEPSLKGNQLPLTILGDDQGGVYLHMSNPYNIKEPRFWRFGADGHLKSLQIPYSQEYGVCKATHIASGEIYGTTSKGGKSGAGIIYSVPLPTSNP